MHELPRAAAAGQSFGASRSSATPRCPHGGAAVIELRPYQKDCVRRIREALRRVLRVLLASPTSSGKTVVFAWLSMAVAEHGSRILILGHRQEIVDQISDTLQTFKVPHGIIAPGHPASDAPVQVAMALTLANRLHHYAGQFDLVVVDEAHHSVAHTWQRILSAFPTAYVLGVTATPERLDGKPLRDIYDALAMGPTTALQATARLDRPRSGPRRAGQARPPLPQGLGLACRQCLRKRGPHGCH